MARLYSFFSTASDSARTIRSVRRTIPRPAIIARGKESGAVAIGIATIATAQMTSPDKESGDAYLLW